FGDDPAHPANPARRRRRWTVTITSPGQDVTPAGWVRLARALVFTRHSRGFTRERVRDFWIEPRAFPYFFLWHFWCHVRPTTKGAARASLNEGVSSRGGFRMGAGL